MDNIVAVSSIIISVSAFWLSLFAFVINRKSAIRTKLTELFTSALNTKSNLFLVEKKLETIKKDFTGSLELIRENLKNCKENLELIQQYRKEISNKIFFKEFSRKIHKLELEILKTEKASITVWKLVNT